MQFIYYDIIDPVFFPLFSFPASRYPAFFPDTAGQTRPEDLTRPILKALRFLYCFMVKQADAGPAPVVQTYRSRFAWFMDLGPIAELVQLLKQNAPAGIK